MKNNNSVSKKTSKPRMAKAIKTEAAKSSTSITNLKNLPSAHPIANPAIQVLTLNRNDLEK
jgi:hypothetical protein